MKLLVSINYGKSITEPLLQSLVNAKEVSLVYVVSDTDALQIPQVRWYRTPRWLRSPFHKVTLRGILRVVAHFMLMLYITLTKRPDVIVGVHIFPQAVYAFICARVIRRPVIACIGDWPGIWRRRRLLIPMLKRCDVVSTTGNRTREYLAKEGISEGKLYERPDPRDLERFHPCSLPKIYDLIFVGRLMPAKNLDILLKAIAEVRKVKGNLKAGIVGDGYLRGSLEGLVERLAITDNVEFIGFRENPEYYYNSSRIFVLTSYYEGLPGAMLEAMACGIPCVVPNVGDITDVAINGLNAMVINDSYDVYGFTRAIIKLLNDEQFYQSLAHNTRQMVEEKCSLDAVTTIWDRMLGSIKQE